MLPIIAKSVEHKNNNADAAKKFAEWAHTAPFEIGLLRLMLTVIVILTLMILSLGLLGSWIAITLVCFLCNRHDMLHPWIYDRCQRSRIR